MEILFGRLLLSKDLIVDPEARQVLKYLIIWDNSREQLDLVLGLSMLQINRTVVLLSRSKTCKEGFPHQTSFLQKGRVILATPMAIKIIGHEWIHLSRVPVPTTPETTQ